MMIARILYPGAAIALAIASASANAQEAALNPGVGPVGPATISGPLAPSIDNCAGGEIYDDGTAENGYSGNAGIISTFEGVQQFTPMSYPGSYETVCLSLVSLAGADLDFEIEVRDDDGAGGTPGTLLGTVPASVSDLPSGLPCSAYEFDISGLGLNIVSGSVYIGVRWNPMTYPSRFICADETPGTPLHLGYVNFNNPDNWQATETVFPAYRALHVRAMPATPGTAIPTLGGWGAIGLAGLLVAFGAWRTRRQQRA